MTTHRTPLLALLVALVALPVLAGPGVAAGPAAGLGTPGTLVPGTLTPTVTATATSMSTATPTSTTAGSVATVAGAVGTVEGSVTTVAASVTTVEGSVATATGTLNAASGSDGGSLLGTVTGLVGSSTSTSLETSLQRERLFRLRTGLALDQSGVGTDTPAGSSPAAATRTAPTPATDTRTTAVAAGGPVAGSGSGAPSAGPGGDGAGDLPVSPLAGGVAIGGAAVLAGLAGRTVLGGAEGLAPAASTAKVTANQLLAGWRDKLRPILGLFGYQRYDDSDPLEHAGRARLFDRVQEEPGIYQSALAEAADLPLSTARYHLRVLEHEGLVRTVTHRGKRRCYPPDVGSKALAAALAEPAPSAVLRSLVRAGPASVSELAERLDRSASTVSYHLDRLEADGLVERERRGPAVVSRATPAVEAAVTAGRGGTSSPIEPRPVAASD